MARSRPRKATVEKARQERSAEHLEHRNRKGVVFLLRDITAGILRDCPPERRKEPMSMGEIESWFDSDPEAPVILCTRPPGEAEDESRTRIAINRHGVERELRARGLDESHPSWEMAVEVVGPTLRDMMAEILQGGDAREPEPMRQLSAVPADL